MPIRHFIALSYAIWPRRHFTMLSAVPEARSTANWPSLLASRALAARPSAILPLLKAELPPKHWPGTAVRYGPFINLDEASLGELLMHFMPEAIIAAHLTGIVQANRPAPPRPGPSHGCVRPSAVHFGLPLCRAPMVVLAVSPLYLQRHWTIPAFDQPAVEEGKVLAKKYLTGC